MKVFNQHSHPLSSRFIKRTFDIFLSIILILIFFPLILIAFILASFDTKSFGLFFQERVGAKGKLFTLIKIKTMTDDYKNHSSISNLNKHRISLIGNFFRKYKIDELPQLINILVGNMSFVGPRPDVEGYADMLKKEDLILLSIRPGITGPASIKYKNEENILSNVDNPKKYNDEIIWPDKVRINKEYIQNYSFSKDLIYIIKTIF